MKAHTTQPIQVSELFSITERNVADSCFAHAAIIDHVKWQQPQNTVYFFHEVPEILLAVLLERIRSSWRQVYQVEREKEWACATVRVTARATDSRRDRD